MEDMSKIDEELQKNLEILHKLNEQRFTFNPNDVSTVTDDGRLLSGKDASLYLEQQRLANTKIHDQLSIGDVVMIKDIDVPLTIVETKFDGGEHLLGSDYGAETEIDDSQIILFDQKDIEEVISKSKRI